MNRLQLTSKQFNQTSPLNFLYFSEFLNSEQKEYCEIIREFAYNKVKPIINDFVEQATFPEQLIQNLKEINPFQFKDMNIFLMGMILLELARVDAGFSTFLFLQKLVLGTIEKFGSQQQKEKFIPPLKNFDIIGGWALTEKNVGSDASSIETIFTKVNGGYILNGNKRWIGNGNRDLLIVWAQNQGVINGFIVDNKWKGVSHSVIQHKIPLRIVQNCDITFDNVFIPEENRLPGVDKFGDITKILTNSRSQIIFIAAGVCIGVYDHVHEYILNRKQFKVPLASFQLQQERLAKMMATIQAILLCCQRIAKLVDEDRATIGMIASMKAWVSKETRDIARLGREMMGGNGILSDNYCMKALVDAEVIYTYEGTYDINALITARELTGISAFKSNSKDIKQ